MKIGDVVWITCARDRESCGYGLYLGPGRRGDRTAGIHTFLWSGDINRPEPRIATFDEPYWEFRVIGDEEERRLSVLKRLFLEGK